MRRVKCKNCDCEILEKTAHENAGLCQACGQQTQAVVNTQDSVEMPCFVRARRYEWPHAQPLGETVSVVKLTEQDYLIRTLISTNRAFEIVDASAYFDGREVTIVYQPVHQGAVCGSHSLQEVQFYLIDEKAGQWPIYLWPMAYSC